MLEVAAASNALHGWQILSDGGQLAIRCEEVDDVQTTHSSEALAPPDSLCKVLCL